AVALTIDCGPPVWPMLPLRINMLVPAAFTDPLKPLVASKVAVPFKVIGLLTTACNPAEALLPSSGLPAAPTIVFPLRIIGRVIVPVFPLNCISEPSLIVIVDCWPARGPDGIVAAATFAVPSIDSVPPGPGVTPPTPRKMFPGLTSAKKMQKKLEPFLERVWLFKSKEPPLVVVDEPTNASWIS